jgi:hypothetical protein
MAVIRYPKPKSVFDPDRPASSLLLAQVQHLQEAELNLPLKYVSKKYTKAITTEGEAAAYIREVTEAIHRAHEDAERARRAANRKKGVAIAAAAEQPSRKRSSMASGKKSTSTSKRKN